MSVLENHVHAKCTHPNQRQMLKQCASIFTNSGLTAEQVIMVDSIQYHSAWCFTAASITCKLILDLLM